VLPPTLLKGSFLPVPLQLLTYYQLLIGLLISLLTRCCRKIRRLTLTHSYIQQTGDSAGQILAL